MRAVLALAGFITITCVAASSGDAHSLQIGPAEEELGADQANTRVVRGAAAKKKIGKGKKQTKNGKKKQNMKKRYKKKRNQKRRNKKKQIKKKKLNKNKTKKRPNKKNVNNLKQKQCSSQQADDACLQNAQDVLVWESTQVKNFMKQYRRYNNFRNQTNNKMGKRFRFDEPMSHMENATGGKDKMTNMTCANNTGTARDNSSYDAAMYMETYYTLINCSVTVEAACSINASSKADAMAECNADMEKISKATKACIDATSQQCTCWNDAATTLMEPIKAKKCNTEMTKMIKAMKVDKAACIEAFKNCKKAEDRTSGLVLNCMEFNAKDDWNKPAPVKVITSA